MSDIIDFNELKTSGARPSPKGVMLAVIRLCQREQASFHELARAIQADPALAGRIIKIANAVNRNKSRSIASISPDVLILVGVQAIRQAVLGLSLASSCRSGSCRAFDYDRFWARSVAMACAAQAIAGFVRIAPAPEVFACGLLAGIGRLGLATARPQAYSSLLEKMDGKPPEELALAEDGMFGFNHLSLAAAMMADWNIPRLFSDAVMFHESPGMSELPAGSRQQKLVHLRHLAGLIADIGIAEDEERERLVPSLFAFGAALELDAGRVALLAGEAAWEWQEWGDMLQVRTRALPPLRAPGRAEGHEDTFPCLQ